MSETVIGHINARPSKAEAGPVRPLYFDLCAWPANPEWDFGPMPAICIASSDYEPLGKGHGYLEVQMIRSQEDLERFIAYLRQLGDNAFGNVSATVQDSLE